MINMERRGDVAENKTAGPEDSKWAVILVTLNNIYHNRSYFSGNC